MAKRRKATHIHQYRRFNIRKSGEEPYFIFKCQIEGCTHHVSREMVVGNQSICWKCTAPFQMSYKATYLAKPVCNNCRSPRYSDTKDDGAKEQQKVMSIEDRLDEILGRDLF